MERLLSRVFVIIFLFLLIHLPLNLCSAPVVEKGVDLVEKTCRRTNNYDLCISSLRSDPRSAKADVKGFSRIMLELSLTKAEITLLYIQQLNNKTTDVIWKRYFSGCIEEYEIAENFLETAILNLGSNDYRESTTNADYASSSAEECEDLFKGPPEPRKSPLTNQNKALHDLADLAGDIIYILVTGVEINKWP